jgi:hypothetical protein
VALIREAGDRAPLLLLVLPNPPPILVRGRGRCSIREAIEAELEHVAAQARVDASRIADLRSRIDSTVAWLTWPTVQQIVNERAAAFATGSESVDGCIKRLAALVDGAVRWHGRADDRH